MMMNDKNKYALITGATSGFGYEFAKLFAADSYNLILVARSNEGLEGVARELTSQYSIDVKTIAQDLFSPNAAEEVYRTVSSWNVTVDVLVNDAGQGEYGKFLDYDLDRDIDLIQLNITAVVGLTKYFGKDMAARNSGKILQVASLLSKYPTPLMAVYAGTKAFVLSFSEALINELKDTNVTVTVLMPGAADTDFFHKAGAEGTVIYRETELSDPTDVAKDGYEALRSGESKVVSGAKNKVQAAMSNMMPDSALAATMRKQMAPSEKGEGRSEITHPASRTERERIQESIGKADGDLEKHEDHAHD